MRISLQLITLLLLFNLKVKSQVNYPDFESVAKHFFTQYSLPDGLYTSMLRFVKHPDGYYIEEYDQNIGNFQTIGLFWSSKTGKFLDVEYPSYKDNQKNNFKEFMNNYKNHYYDLFPYYGYTGWEHDVTNVLENKKHLTEDELYALARSYSSLSSYCMNNNFGYADTSKIFVKQEYGKNLLNSEQLEIYKQLTGKAINYYKKLNKRNPDYNTIVGNIGVKLANEYMTAFLNLRVYQNEGEANKYLPEGIYAPCMINMAKTYLYSCDSNAILFTNGDNDTYPLLYVQSKLGIRQDVLVINQMLLNSNNYINHFRNSEILKADSVSFSIHRNAHSNDNLTIIYLNPVLPDTTFHSAKKVLSIMNTNNKDTWISISGNHKFRRLISQNLTFDYGPQKTFDYKIDKKYVTRGELLTLDIVANNLFYRPIYFTDTYNQLFKEYFELSGIVFKLTNKKTTNNLLHLPENINVQKTSSVLIDGNQLNTETNYGSCSKFYMNILCRSYSALIINYAKLGDTTLTKTVIDNFKPVLISQSLQINLDLISILYTIHKINMQHETDFILNILIDKILQKIKNVEKDDIRVIEYFINELTSAKYSNNPEIIKKMEVVSNKFYKLKESM